MTIPAANAIFVDTNILIYLTSGTSPWHQQAMERVEALRQAGTPLVISTQIMREYLATATRPNPHGIGLPLANVLANLRAFEQQFRVVEDNKAVFDSLTDIVQNIPVAGRQIHDANIVATMQVYGVSHLLTHNTADFTRYAGLITVLPLVTGTP